MLTLLFAIGLLVFSGIAALFAGRSPLISTVIGVSGALVSCVVGLVPAIRVLSLGTVESFRTVWQVPGGSFYVELDALSALFLIPILGVSAICVLYGGQYLQVYKNENKLGWAWLWVNLLIASMVLVVVARNAILFLVAWEIMSLSSYFLVTFQYYRKGVREAGWTYLIATQLGTAFLLVLFILLGESGGSLDFDHFMFTHGSWSGISANVLLVLAIIGFGTKAGVVPFHVWLPEAHPAAPSHVSAIMSGVMIKTGIYGLLRTLTFLGSPPEWWGWLLIGIGMTSGVLGVLYAIAQHDLKRLLAYHSVENIGIITLGIGIGVLGISIQSPQMIALGFAGGLLHVINHAFFKSLLFLGAGSIIHATGTAEVDRLGGLLKRMPWTGVTFLIGAVAISGLPPLNGFISEFLIYVGAFTGAIQKTTPLAPLIGVIASLALIGGLAAACFAKAFGISFLGEARSQHAANPHEVGWIMRSSMLLLAAGCLLIVIFSPRLIGMMSSPIAVITGLPTTSLLMELQPASDWLWTILQVVSIFLGLLGILATIRYLLLRRKQVELNVTWDCGYVQPSSGRMQYTASSFAQPITDLSRLFLGTSKTFIPPQGYFPEASSFHTDTPDWYRRHIYGYLFSGLCWLSSKLRWFQHGRVHLYILYIAVTLLLLLIWNLG